MILFSSIFYLIGLTVGSTIENVKNSLIPSKSVITVPAKKVEKSEKTFQMKSKERESKIRKTEPEPVKESGSATLSAPNDSLSADQG